jgi:zinc D-Ala-D-Ala carboxypeptidase
MLLSRYHRLEQLAYSETALRESIDNTPPPELLSNLRRLARGLDRVVELLGHPLEISSGYRCERLNQRVGGTPGSQHVLGSAVDFTCEAFGPPAEVAAVIAGSSIRFDQCILEFGRWVHLSFAPRPRRRTLTIYAPGEYLEGLRRPDGSLLGGPGGYSPGKAEGSNPAEPVSGSG